MLFKKRQIFHIEKKSACYIIQLGIKWEGSLSKIR